MEKRQPKASVTHNLPLYQRLRFLRLVNKITQAQLADISNIHILTIIAMETGKRQNFTFNTLNKIAKALGCEVKIDIKPRKNGRGKPMRLDYRYLTQSGRIASHPRHRTPEEHAGIVRAVDKSARNANYRRKIPPPTKRISADDPGP